MVFYFTSNGVFKLPGLPVQVLNRLFPSLCELIGLKVVDPPAMIYMGKDKFESKWN